MVPNFIQQRWSWISGFQLFLAFKAQSKASSRSVLTMSANQQLTPSVISTGLEKSFHFFFIELTFTISSWFEHSPFFFFQKVFLYASIHLCRAVGFWLWSCFMTSKRFKKLFRFMYLQAKGKSPFLPDFPCIQKTSKEI